MKEETGIMVFPVCRPFFVAPFALARIYGVQFPGDWFEKETCSSCNKCISKPHGVWRKFADLLDDANDRRSISLDIGSYIATLAREDCLGDLDVFSVFFEEGWMGFPKVSAEMEAILV